MERETGWYVLGNRLYSPVLRRFLGPDPQSPFDDGGFNRYAYCSGDPISRIDPTGNAWTDWLATGLMVALSVVGTIVSHGMLAAPMAAASAASSAATATAAGFGSTATALAGSYAAAATPGLVVAATAAVMDTVSTVAAIGSVVSMATHNQKANSILGWVAMGAGVLSGAFTITAGKRMAKASTAAGGSRKAFGGGRVTNAVTAHTTVSTARALMSAVPRARGGTPQRPFSHDPVVSDAPAPNRVADASVDTSGWAQQVFRRPHQSPRRTSMRADSAAMQTTGPAGSPAGLPSASVETTPTGDSARQRMDENPGAAGYGLSAGIPALLNMPDAGADHPQPVRAGP
jgi:RHS repeat-associated protein